MTKYVKKHLDEVKRGECFIVGSANPEKFMKDPSKSRYGIFMKANCYDNSQWIYVNLKNGECYKKYNRKSPYVFILKGNFNGNFIKK